jgi:hypothetical protein
MSVSMASSLPRTEVLGFKDVSGRGQPLEISTLPIFLPYMPLLTAWGPEDNAHLVSGNGFSTIYGADSFAPGSPLRTHQSVLTEKVMGVGGMALVRRLLAPGAARANTRVWIDIVADKVKQYERNIDGSFKRTNGALVTTGTPVDGHRSRFVITQIDLEDDGVGKGEAIVGGLVAADGTESTMYPLFDIDARFFGERGSNTGFRLVAPTLKSGIAANVDLIDEKGAYLYRFYAMSRVDATTGGSVLSTMDGEQYVEFSLKKGFVDKKTNIDYSVDKRILPGYESKDPKNFNGYGPLKTFHVYQANVATVLAAIYEEEKGFGTITSEITPEQTINLLGGQTPEGIPYYSYEILGPQDGGVMFGESATHWLKGGSDGVIEADPYDKLVADELSIFGEGLVPYADKASYPMSAMVDTGFTVSTKMLMGNVMRVRPDAWVVASTQDVLESLNTPAEDSSIGAVLRNSLQLIPESEFYGTGACRAVVMKHAGTYLASDYDGILPFTIDWAVKLAVYMGGADGKMKEGYATDSEDFRVVDTFIEHNAKFRNAVPRNKDWQNGITSAEPYDHRQSVFFPGIQTIYHDNTSVLNSFYPMAICCHLNRIGELAWRMFTGDSRLTSLQYADRVDRFIEAQTKDCYDQRADITPRSYYTPADTRRGYSWHTDIEGLFDGMKTVETLTIIAGRRAAATGETA